MDLMDFSDPIEVWKMVEGDPTELIALLRSDSPIWRQNRIALAAYFAGELRPVQLPKGRPSVPHSPARAMIRHRMWQGHDVTTQLGAAGFHFATTKHFFRSKGWHLNNPGWSDRLRDAVAKRHDIDLEQFINYLRRSRPKPQSKPYSHAEQTEYRRVKIALEIRREKMAQND